MILIFLIFCLLKKKNPMFPTTKMMIRVQNLEKPFSGEVKYNRLPWKWQLGPSRCEGGGGFHGYAYRGRGGGSLGAAKAPSCRKVLFNHS